MYDKLYELIVYLLLFCFIVMYRLHDFFQDKVLNNLILSSLIKYISWFMSEV